MVTDNTLVQTGPFGGDALVAAMSVTPHLRETLFTGDRWTGVGETSGLPVVTLTGGAGVFVPLLSVLVLSSCRQTGIRHTLWTALTSTDHQVFTRFTDDRLTLGHRTLNVSVAAQTLRAQTRPPSLAIGHQGAANRARRSST